MSSPYEMAYEDYARERREYLNKRSEACAHQWAPEECDDSGNVTTLYCVKCQLIKGVTTNG